MFVVDDAVGLSVSKMVGQRFACLTVFASGNVKSLSLCQLVSLLVSLLFLCP